MGQHRLATPDLVRVFRGETVAGLSEWQLLERYRQERDEVAFEALVARHGPMVLGVCRRMLSNQADVDDAFQATFLVLVRRAGQLGPRDKIGPWLYGVATRVALRARSEAVRRLRFVPITSDIDGAIEYPSIADHEIGQVLDQELSRLPSKYRHPIVLCYLEGQTHEEAARQLAWPVGTVKGRLARARELLQTRLTRRGVAPAVGALSLTLSLSHQSCASLHRPLLDRTVRLALQSAVRHASSQIVPASITSLVEGVLTSMLLTTLKWTCLGILIGGLALCSVAVMARQDTKPVQAKPADPLAVARAPRTSANPIKDKAVIPEQPAAPTAEPRKERDAKTRMILEKLDEPISMSFADNTPLEDVLKYVKQATTTPTYLGIPIYVDPLGLQEAEKSMTSTVGNMDLEGVPLRRTLQLLLKQIDLSYFVEDGMLYITSVDSEIAKRHLEPAMAEPSPIVQKVASAERGELSLAEMQELVELLKTREQIRKLDSGDIADESHETKESETGKRQREAMTSLLKEIRGLVDELKAERQKEKAGEKK